VKCKICEAEANLFFRGNILQKYEIDYYRCPCCDFIQTEHPFWLKEAYADAIADSDIGVLFRTIELSDFAEKVLHSFYPTSRHYLDYGGGYGLFVRRMRDKGFDFYWDDPYCKNIFAKHFCLANAPVDRFDVVTSFEVFEHLSEPLDEIVKMFAKGDSLVFSTVLAPQTKEEFAEWWYRSSLTGQHIAFYSTKTLEHIAGLFHKKLYSYQEKVHIFSALEINPDIVQDVLFNIKPKEKFLKNIKEKFTTSIKEKFFKKPANINLSNRQSLLFSDYQSILSKAFSKKE